jgi:hypothetical protein
VRDRRDAAQGDRFGKALYMRHFGPGTECREPLGDTMLGGHRLGQHDVAAGAFALQPRC